MKRVAASVVIPTRDRPDELSRCLAAVLAQKCDREFEIVVVNDAGCALEGVVGSDERVSLVQGSGLGPAAARNAGIALAASDVVVFTDDDTIPQPGWLQAALEALRRSGEAVGVVGRVESPAFDPLYAYSVRGDGLGNFLTCNVAYRRAALELLGGFDTGFPYPHGEDVDLGYRIQEIGRVLYEPRMLVVHPPRPVAIQAVARRGRFIRSEWRLHQRHPQTRPPRWSVRWGPLIRVARHWQRLLTDEDVIRGSPRRAVRFVAMAGAQLLIGLAVTLRGPDSLPGRGLARGARDPGRLRVAWIGAEAEGGADAARRSWLLMEALAREGCSVDCYVSGSHEELSQRVAGLPTVRLINCETGWRNHGSSTDRGLARALGAMVARLRARRRLASVLLEQHRSRPYDAAYQFSTIAFFHSLRHESDDLPPLVVHPITDVAAELRRARRERRVSSRREPLWRGIFAELLLSRQAARQRRDVHLATRVAAESRRFGDQLVRDYGLDPTRLTLIRSPIDLEAMALVPRSERAGPWRIAFASRMSGSSGVQMEELVRRLADLVGAVIVEIGDPGLTATIAAADLLVQTDELEPTGQVVGEALALGVPVVATDNVGAVEDVSDACCTVVPAGDVGALESATRGMLTRLRGSAGPTIHERARAEAYRLFSPDAVAAVALETLAAAGRGGGSEARPRDHWEYARM